MKKIEKSIKLGGSELKLSTGHFAYQSSGAVMATYGETVVMATVVAADQRVDLGYFPLSVEYQERLYAGGRIKGSRWVKREGRPSDDEVLTARLIDRSIRPLFPNGYKKEVQIIITVLSVDLENSPETVAGIAASAALAVSPIPWQGPVAITRVGMVDDKFVLGPTEADLKNSKLDLFVSTTKDAIVMIEAGANEVTEDKMFEAIEYAQKEGGAVISLIEELAKAVGVKKDKFEAETPKTALVSAVKKAAGANLKKLVTDMATKEASYSDFDEFKASVASQFTDEKESKQAKQVFEDLFGEEVRKMILSGKRPDGRALDEIRELSAEVSILPRTHGSATFQRGLTQVLSIATLGAPSLELTIETAEGEETKRYIHHYSMPPYSVGETGRVGYPGRREIGHGALAERALLPVIPSEEEFPYTIRIVSEVLSSNGSTSMASTCGSTLSLMDAGVPIKAPVAGIAMGLIIESEKKYSVLTDIVGLEDGNGDMDFKVAGTKEGITALQLDVKTLKLTSKILKDAFAQAKKARMEILGVMASVIDAPRDTVSLHAPKIKIVKIPVDKIGELIGPGGKTIKGIIASTGAQVDVDDDGTVFISGLGQEEVQKAVETVEGIAKDPQVGEIYEGEVKRIENYGAFVEFLPGKNGLVHVSDMKEDFVKDPHDVLEMDQKVQVRIKGIDELGRINLSMVLDPSHDAKKEETRRTFDKRDRRGQSSRRDGRKSGNDWKKDTRRMSSGPHFPTSRLLDEVKGNKNNSR